MSFSELKKDFLDISLALISGILLILCFWPTANLESLAWFAFLPLFFCLQNKSKGKAFLFSYLCGIIFWFGTIYWLIHVTFVGLILLVLYSALYFGVFGFITNRCQILDTRYSIFFIPSVWVLLEYMRSHLFTGFGWALLGYSQYLNLPIIQIANITGVWGVSFLVMMVNVLVYWILDAGYLMLVKKQKPIFSIANYILALVLLLLSLSYGFYKLHLSSSIQHLESIKIAVIQGNIPQAMKWKETAREEILKRYLGLSRFAANDSADLIIWPEAALPGILGRDAYLIEKLKTFVDDVQIPLLTGAVRVSRNIYYNSAILIPGQGEFAPSGRSHQSKDRSSFLTGPIQRYDKLHLVPFGEYTPLKRISGFLETIVLIGDFVPGEDYTVFSLNREDTDSIGNGQTKFSVLICFEDIFPEISRQFVKRGADFLINITNDAWFGDTSSPYQHLSASVFRAVENGVYLVRAANTGISAFITPEGRVYPLIDDDSGKQTFISGYKIKDIFPIFKQNSFYMQWGDWLVLVCGIIAMCGIVIVKSRKKI